MAKYYTEQAPTPVFAVTFVSNRKGIVEQKKVDNNISNTPKQQLNEEEITNPQYKYLAGQKEREDFFITAINNIKKTKKNTPTPQEKERFNKALKDARDELREYRIEQLKTFYDGTSDGNKTTIPTEDVEYLIYSNLQIESIGPDDLSQQSNWYLRDADVELTRDLPVCKAKLIIAAKLNDDGSIPQIKQVENGFIYNQSQQIGADGKPTNGVDFTLIPGGRFLSADDEVRIYAGYKNDTCISMDDLGQYPFKFQYLKIDNKIEENINQKQKSQIENYSLILKELDKVNNISNKQYSSLQEYKNDLNELKKVVTLINSKFIKAPSENTVLLLPFSIEYKLSDTPTTLEIKNTEDYKKFIESAKSQIETLLKANQTNNNSVTLTDLGGSEAEKAQLAPIFWGFIDSVDFISNSEAGVQIIYNLRDRSRILADTKLVTLPYLNKDSNERGAFEGLRHKTIEGVYKATNGGVYLDNNHISATSTQWRDGFDVGEVITLYDNKIDNTGNRISDQVGKITETRSALAQQRIKFSAAFENQAQWVIANSFLSSKDIKQGDKISKYDPLFHIWTLQPPVVQGGGQSVMQIVNKSPFEILTYLQVTEVMPIDFFSSHVNGHFLFAPRVLDTSGLNDPERGNRLYFFFQCFDKVPEARSLIKDIRVQTSTIGVYNRFAVANAEFNNPTNASLTDLYTVVDIASANTKNRKVPIKQHIIVDPKIKDQSNKEGYAQGLALTTASIMARDNTTVIFKIIGDSTFYPGEAVRVYNTVLHGKDTFTFNSQTESSASFLRDLYQEVQKLKEGNGAVKQGGSQNKVVNLNAVINEIRKGSGTQSDDLNDVLPMYKVRAITHSLKAGGSDAGYTTKIVAIADIL